MTNEITRLLADTPLSINDIQQLQLSSIYVAVTLCCGGLVSLLYLVAAVAFLLDDTEDSNAQ